MTDPFLGQLLWAGFNFAPRNWTMAHGQVLPINSNQALYSLLGTAYGGDGRTDFALPDLRGRFPRGIGSEGNLTDVSLGEWDGVVEQTIDLTNMPAHSHNMTAGAEGIGSGPTTTAADSYMGNAQDNMYRTAASATDLTLATDAVNSAGSGTSFNIMNPYLGLTVCIALEGTFPPRN